MEDGVLPGTVFTARQVRLLKIAVITMGVLLVGGFCFVVAAIVYQASQIGQDAADPAAATSGASELVIAPGSTVSALDLDGSRLAMILKGPSGEEVVVINAQSGRVLLRVPLRPR